MIRIVEVAIGLALVFTLVSLICSILNEWISGMLAQRGRMLWRGVENLVGKEVSDALCRHQLLQGLVQKATWFDRLVFFIDRSKPAYIPTNTFVLTLLDVIGARAKPVQDARARTQPAQQTQQAQQAPPPAAAALPAKAPLTTSVASRTWKERARELGRRVVESVRGLARTGPTLPTAGTGNPATQVIGALPENVSAFCQAIQDAPLPDHVRQALLALAKDAGADLDKAKANIAQWFDSGMDSVSAWYKRWSQILLLVLALLVAGSFGVDSLLIGKALWNDDALRAETTRIAEDFVRERQKAEAAKPSGASPAEQSIEQLTDKAKKDLDEVQRALTGLPVPLASFGDALEDANLPEDLKRWEWLKQRAGVFLGWLGGHWIGFLLTALAASLGAPFWFDLLNKFVSLRASGKRPETQKLPAPQEKKA